MKKKEYFSPKSVLVLLDSSVLDEGTIPGDGGSGGRVGVAVKGTNDWQEPEYDDDDGFGW